MRKYVATLFICMYSYLGIAQPCANFDSLNTAIRDGKIARAEARLLFAHTAMQLLKSRDGFTRTFTFPVAGYTWKAAGGKNGSGFIASGYNYFDGNKHGGHPAHDIFIHDTDEDGADDKTGKPVTVVAATDGIVVAVEKNWQAGSLQRGGNYVYVFNPADSTLYYYAHNSDVLIHLCDRVTSGQHIAHVGRTGTNAIKKRSPTHLHFMMLKLGSDLLPVAVNGWGKER